MSDILLEVRDLHAYYGESHVLHGVDLEVRTGELVTLLGRNGAGRTSTLKAIMNLTDRKTGAVRFKGQDIGKLEPHEIARRGIGYCPEERGIYAGLSTEENLLLPPVVQPGGMSVEEIYAMFPNLQERRRSPGTRLSGGEQQMLAMARILRTGCDFILLDEPTEGLAPVIVEQIGEALVRLKEKGFTVLLVEQNLNFARGVADRHYVMEQGRIIDEIANASLSAQMDKLNRFLGI